MQFQTDMHDEKLASSLFLNQPGWFWLGTVGFALPEPRRGGLTIAQGKAAEAAALGKKPADRKSFCVRNPGRRFSCPGLFSFHPLHQTEMRIEAANSGQFS